MHVICPHCYNPIEFVKLNPREEIACPGCGSSFRLEGSATTGSAESAGRKLGKFDLIETLGHGAFGSVFKARDPELDRVVAIKVPRAGNLAEPQELDRFLREARSVAQLRHPSIVSVHEVGQQDGVPYLVSDFVRGVTLADLLSARRPAFREVAGLVAAVADALQYAHERGVVHRDVKPSNIMIGEDGTPSVMDFGLAKRDAGEITMTVEGQVLGTPAYMPPEQARGEGHSVDARGDVYSLGVVLYELLTGELPFRGTKRMLLHQVLHDEPRPPRSLNDHIPRDLQTITLKAMAKEPGKRYATAHDLADDLRRWLRGEPIQARPVGHWERALRWTRRRPAVAALVVMSSVAALALVGLAVGAIYNNHLEAAYQSEAEARQREEMERKKAEELLGVAEAAKAGEEVERARAQEALKKAEDAHQKVTEALALVDQTAYSHSIFLAGMALRDNNVVQAKQRLEECKAGLRGWEWRYLKGQCHAELCSFPGSQPVFSPDGTRIAVTGRDGAVGVYEAFTGQMALALKGPAPLSIPVFSPDGTRIVAPGEDGVVRVYETRTGRETLVLKGPSYFNSAVFSPDGRLVAAESPNQGAVGRGRRFSGDADGMVRLYDAGTGKEVLALKGPASLGFVVFSPDGTRIAVRGGDRVMRVYDARTGQEVFAFKGLSPFQGPVLSPDGALIAATDVDSGLRVYDARTGQEAIAIKGQQSVLAPVFSPDGARIAAKHRDGVLRVYDARTGQEAQALKVSVSAVGIGITVFQADAPVFSPDGARIAAMGGDGVLRVYHVGTGQESLALKGVDRQARPVFSPDGARIAATCTDGLVRVYDARASQEAHVIKVPYLPGSLQFSPDGTRIVAQSNPFAAMDRRDDGVVWVYDVRTGQEVLALRGPASRTAKSVLSPDGSRIAVYSSAVRNRLRDGDGTVRVYDARTGRELSIIRGPSPLDRVVFSPDGTRLAATGTDRVVRVYDARTGKESLALKGASLVWPVFSPDGAHIVGKGADGLVRLYDARSGKEALVLKGSPAFSPDGNRIAVWGADRLLRIYDGRTGQELSSVNGEDRFDEPEFSPDGSRIAIGGRDGVVRVYDGRTGQETLALKGPGRLSSPRFSPDGTRIVTHATEDDRSDRMRVYDARTGQETLALRAPGGHSSLPVFSPDGTRIAGHGLRALVIFEALPGIEDWRALRRERVILGKAEWHRAEGETAVRERQWFTAEFHLARLCEIKPDIGHHHFNRGQALMGLGRDAAGRQEFEKALSLKDTLSEVERAHAHAELGQWTEAANEFAKVVAARSVDQQSSPLALAQLQADQQAWSALALVKLQLGDRVGYSKACAAMLEHYGKKAPSFLSDNSVIWVCVRVSGAVSDMVPVVDRARDAVKRQPAAWQAHSTLGAALYRTGKYEEAVAELTKATQLHEGGKSPLDLLFLAMVDHQLARPTDAHTQIEKARQVHAKQPSVLWTDRLEWQLLHREAELLLKEPPPDPTK